MEFKVGDKVEVIEEKLSREDTENYMLAEIFIRGNEDVFLVININECEDFPVEIAKENGEKLSFKEWELRKVEE